MCIRDSISDIPIQNANQGLYPNCGTSRDYGYGIMGFPTFTFETDDEQFIPGTFEDVNDRLAEEMDVMRYLIENVWHWRARLVVESVSIEEGELTLDITNHGQASTANASLEYLSETNEVLWSSPLFGVNATNHSVVSFPFEQSVLKSTGTWNLNYQKRVINAATWVNESVDENTSITVVGSDERMLTGAGLFNPVSVIIGMIGVALLARRETLPEA